MSLAQSQSKSTVFERSNTNGRRFNAHHSHTPTNETDKAISFINSQNLGWKADTCMLSKDHKEYGAHCGKKVSLAQKSNLVQTKTFGENTSTFQNALKKA